jgi:DNA-binding beta-propeller fold protein YncE
MDAIDRTARCNVATTKQRTLVFLAVLAAWVLSGLGPTERATASAASPGQAGAGDVPAFQVDPKWPQLPGKGVLGLVSGIAVDADDHVWVLHRPRTVRPNETAAPAVLEFDASGKFIQAWGGPGQGYEWPGTEHGISVDSRGFVWIGGSGNKDHQVLKFTKNGKFLLQIGRAGQSKGNTDTANVNGPADVFLYAKTNEVFVADGYGNRRVIVFDADTGAFKRMWGAFGNVPADPKPKEPLFSADDETGNGPQQFNGVHAVRVSNDDLVYVCDRDNQRIQVFTLAGKYLTQVFISRGKMPPSQATGTALGKPLKDLEDEVLRDPSAASRTAFSPDPGQRFLYVIDRRHQRVLILDRKSLQTLGSFGGGIGSAPGQFYILHDIAADSKGNIYTAEVNNNGNRRAQKFAIRSKL